jgi:hypothetical protein
MLPVKFCPKLTTNEANPYTRTINKAIIPNGLFVNPFADSENSLMFIFTTS